MNERIRELAEQAGLDIEVDEDEDASYVFNETLEYIEESYGIDLKKFAELIVKECISVARQQRNPANLNYKPSERFVEDLRQHFGVEE